jgi:hypothetical protein
MVATLDWYQSNLNFSIHNCRIADNEGNLIEFIEVLDS